VAGGSLRQVLARYRLAPSRHLVPGDDGGVTGWVMGNLAQLPPRHQPLPNLSRGPAQGPTGSPTCCPAQGPTRPGSGSRPGFRPRCAPQTASDARSGMSRGVAPPRRGALREPGSFDCQHRHEVHRGTLQFGGHVPQAASIAALRMLRREQGRQGHIEDMYSQLGSGAR